MTVKNYIEASRDECLNIASEESTYNSLFQKCCKAQHDGWYCTRTSGHTGRHVAHGYMNEAFAAWEDAAN